MGFNSAFKGLIYFVARDKILITETDTRVVYNTQCIVTINGGHLLEYP
jgi:hypothetical protein